MIGIVVLNYNDWKTTLDFVISINGYSCFDKIVIVDNCSTDDSFERLYHLKSDKIDVIKSHKNGGYGYGNNLGIEHLKDHYDAEIIFISNPDVIVSEDVIAKCITVLRMQDDSGIVAPMMKNIDYSVNPKCVWRIPTYLEYLFFPFKVFQPFSNKIYYNIENLKDDIIRVDCIAGSFLEYQIAYLKERNYLMRISFYIAKKHFWE